MQIVIYLLEWIGSFFVIWLMNIGSMYLFRKKFNLITSAIFTFMAVGLIVFLTAPYLISFSEPALFYLPFLIFWFVVNLRKANQEEG